MEFGREPASSCYFAAGKLDDRSNFSSNQLRTSFEPASVMEFGFNTLATGVVGLQISLYQGSKAPKQEGEWEGRQDHWHGHHAHLELSS